MIEVIGDLGYPRSLSRDLRRQPVAGATPLAEAVRIGQPIWRELDDATDPRYIDFIRSARTPTLAVPPYRCWPRAASSARSA